MDSKNFEMKMDEELTINDVGSSSSDVGGGGWGRHNKAEDEVFFALNIFVLIQNINSY